MACTRRAVGTSQAEGWRALGVLLVLHKQKDGVH